MINQGRMAVVVEMDGSRLSAVSATLSKGMVEVRRWISAMRPETVLADDAGAVGAWAESELAKAGMVKAQAIVSVSRGDVVLKWLTVPHAGRASEAELGGMVRLQLTRQLTMPIEGTAIDYAPMPAEAGSETWPVLAGAMPANRVLWCRTFAESAGLKLNRIGLRCFGVAAALGPMSQTRAGTIVGVAVGWGSTELVVVEDGQMTFARAVDVPRPLARSEHEAFSERIAVELKRTWMGYRSNKTGGAPDLVAVLGEGDLAHLVGEKCGALLESPSKVVGSPASVKLPTEMPESERSATAPLVGLLLEELLGRPTIDFANPRRPVNRAQQLRTAGLAAALGVILLGGAGYTLAKSAVAAVESKITLLENQQHDLTGDYERMLVDHARLGNFQQWAGARVDWLGHINTMCGQVPQGGVAYAEDVRGILESTVAFSPKGGTKTVKYPEGEWTTDPSVKFDFKGKVMGSGIATDMRARFLVGDLYTVETMGPDLSDKFSLQLRTKTVTPMDAVPAGKDASKSDAGKTDASKAGKPGATRAKGDGKGGAKPESKPEPKPEASPGDPKVKAAEPKIESKSEPKKGGQE